MIYMGSKSRIAKHILPIMLADRGERTWVEPFVGGGNMIDKVDGKRIGADVNPYLIAALKLIRDNVWAIPDIVTENEYNQTKSYGVGWMAPSGLHGWIGFALSFGGKWFGGYRRDKVGNKGSKENEIIQTQRAKKSAVKQSIFFKGIEFLCSSYSELDIPENSIIYCDPPYAGTTKYKDSFDHVAFWQWCRGKAKDGHKVYISEYTAPDDFECIWEGHICSKVGKSEKKTVATEKLFTYKG